MKKNRIYAILMAAVMFSLNISSVHASSIDQLVEHADKAYVHTPQIVHGQDEDGRYCVNRRCTLTWSEDMTVSVDRNSWRAALSFFRALVNNPTNVDPTYLPGTCYRRIEVNYPIGAECEAYFESLNQ